ncbi:MAG: hypothetical protein OHK0046_17700 [Anaerolineae bacterium]
MSARIDPNNPLPLYYQVYASLRERINDGEFAPGTALPPERQLVEDYGVSRITIVKALDKLASDDLIERQHGRGTFVKAPAVQETTHDLIVIGFLPSGLLHPFHYSVQLGIAQVTTEKHYYLQVFGLDSNARDKTENVLKLVTNSTDGLIVYPRPNNLDYRLYERLTDLGIPFVMVDRYYEGIEADYAGYNSEAGGYALARLLIKRGHERIAILPHHEVNASAIRDRIAGYRRAMREAGLNDIDDLIWLDVYSDYRPTLSQKGNPAMTEALRAKLNEYRPTALLSINHDVAERLTFDLMTINAERARVAIAQNGSPNYEIDIEIATFGVNPPEDYGPYTVAVAYQPGEPLGHQAARLLLDRLHGDFQGPPRRVELPIEILKRKEN